MVVEMALRLNSFVQSDPRSSTEMLRLGKRRECMADSLRSRYSSCRHKIADNREAVAEHIVAGCRWVECLELAVNPDVGSHQSLMHRACGGASSFACSSTVLHSACRCPGMLLLHMAALLGSH